VGYGLLALVAVVGVGTLWLHHTRGHESARWAFLGVASAMLGEPGAMVEKLDTKRIYPMIAGGVLLLFSVYFTMELQAIVSTQQIKNQITTNEIQNSIAHKRIVHNTGSAYVNFVRRNKAIPVDVGTPTGKTQYFLDHPDKVDGVMLELSRALDFIEGRPSVAISKANLGYDPIAFFVSHKFPDLLRALNTNIVKAKESGTMNEICRKHNHPSVCFV
jgi:hypothetical protein